MDLQTRDRAPTDVEALSAGQPGVPLEGAERSQAAGARRGPGGLGRLPQLALGGLILLALAALALHMSVRPRHEALDAMPDTLRAIAATFVLFGVGGFGLT